MPKVKVYKSGSTIVPVESAKISTGYQCPWTKKLFVTKKAYVGHLGKLRESRIREINRAKKFAHLTNEFNNSNTFPKIIDWIERNSNYFLANAKKHYHFDGSKWPDPEDFWIKITYLRVRHCEVSNYHSRPRNGVTNWGGYNRDLPRGYPGWEGRIEYQTSHELPTFGSDVFRNTGLHTGSGGGMSKNRFGFEVRFFDADWPGLEKARVLSILSEKEPDEFQYGVPYYFR